MLLSLEQTREMIIHVANMVIESKPLLTEKDSAIGDGDHGVGMAAGFTKVIEKLSGTQARSINEIMTATGRVMISSMGGASGIIFGTMFSGAAKGMAEVQEWDETAFADFFQRSLDAIKERGGAQPGDKTMVDALEPAVQALKTYQGQGFTVMLNEAAKAAKSGMENTKNLSAKIGRAKSLMERSLGHEDPGAVSVWIIFEAMHAYFESL
jgi:dihydroxyacetone kinase phosphoprotein-dependent L subunit